MAIEINGDSIVITLNKDGETHERRFSPDKSARDAIMEVGREFHLSSVIAKDEDNEELTNADLNQTMGDVGNLTLTPKTTGA